MDETHQETGKREIELNLPFDRTFDACMQALQKFMFREIDRFDPVRGTIEARVSNPDFKAAGILGLPGRESRITIVLQKQSPKMTRIVVMSQTIIPEDFESISPNPPCNPDRDFENLMIVTAFLRSRESQPGQKLRLEEILAEPGHPKENWMLIDPSEPAFMSLVLPGLGQNYAGRYLRGIAIAVLVAAGLVFYIIPGVLVWILGTYDAYRVAQQVNRGSLPFVPVDSIRLYLHVAAGGGLLFLLFLSGFIGYFPFHG
jgi:hypothetical protein